MLDAVDALIVGVERAAAVESQTVAAVTSVLERVLRQVCGQPPREGSGGGGQQRADLVARAKQQGQMRPAYTASKLSDLQGYLSGLGGDAGLTDG